MSNPNHSMKMLFSLLPIFLGVSIWNQVPSPLNASPLRQKQAVPPTPSQVARTQVKVFFPRDPSIEEDFTRVEPVWRTTSSQGLARFAIEQLIAGPTRQERTRRLISTIRLTGSSNCGKDFTLSISNRVARLQFCKTFIYDGVGDVARTKSSINATLLQFPTISSVIILDKNGRCWADDSGENTCLRPKA